MKKFWISILSALLLVVTMGAVGCNSSDEKFKAFTDGFNAAVDATSIDQSIEVKNGNLLVYSLEKFYTQGESGFTVTGEEKTLNEVGEAEPYTVTPINKTVQKADTFTTSLKLYEKAFEKYEIKDDKLTASVKDAYVDEVFGLSGSHADISDVKLEITLYESGTDFNVIFKSGSYDVSITLTFSY